MSALGSEADSALARTGSRVLRAGTLLTVASFGLTAIAFTALVFVDLDGIAAWAWWFAGLLGAPAIWYAMRVNLDAALFRDLARPSRDGETMTTRLAALDAALVATGLAAGGRAAGPRPLVDRLQGARTLLVRQAAVTGAQLACALVASLPA